mmetsp:Transcript_35961/g.101212  ORF Transcript_35961/g.101212 Transcript_35961/m.101212 type:complete len:2433 (+) Transcript_35961:59-7357(+)
MALSLKIWLEQENLTKIMKFGQVMSIAEVTKEIRERTDSGGIDHGIFLPGDEEKGEPGQWLQADRTLGYYDILSGTMIQYKKKHRARKVRFLDDTLKTRLIDESLGVMGIVEQIAQAEDIPNAEEFGLQIEGTERWLESHKTLQENFVKDDDVLVLARKFWFSDANVSVDSPKELHLLYVQAKGMIVRGVLPTTKEQAVDLAALGLQIRHGNFDPERCKKKSWFEAEEYLPKGYYKSKKKLQDIEKDVAKEWKRKVGLNESNAKFRYLQTCRSLPTWGITHWRVEERIQTKKNAPPKFRWIRLGVTRKSVMVLDDKTYEVLKEWTMAKIKRWSASDISFTLDLGDYEDEYLVCRTRKGGEISAQLAGYIDIILKQKRQAPNLRTEDDSQTAKVTNVAVTRGHAAKARTSATAAGGGMHTAEGYMHDGQQNYGLMPGQGPHAFGIPGLNQEQVDGMGIAGAAHVTDLDSAITGIDGFIAALGTPLSGAALPQHMNVQDLRQRFVESVNSAQRGALNMIDMMTNGSFNQQFLDQEAMKLTNDLGAIIAAAKLAAAGDDQDISLLPGAYAISEAISKILQVSKDMANGVQTDPQFATWMAQQSLKAAEMCLACAQQGYLSDGASKELILASAKCVAEASSQLKGAGDAHAGNNPQLYQASRNVGALGEHTLFTANALSQTMLHPQAQKMVEDCITQLHQACGTLLARNQEYGQDPGILSKLSNAARGVTDSMAQLLAATKQASFVTEDFSDLGKQGELLKQHCSTLMSQSANAEEILVAYKGLAGAANRMTSQAKVLAGKSPDDLKNKLLNAARALAQQTGRLFEAVKTTSQNPKDYHLQTHLKDEAGLLQGMADEMVQEFSRQAAMMTLRHLAKVTCAHGLNVSSKARLVPVSDPNSRGQLLQNADTTTQAISKLLASIQQSTGDPFNPAVQANIIGESKKVAGAESALVACSKRSGNAITDLSKKTDLLSCADDLQRSLRSLLEACDQCEDFAGGKESREAMQGIEALQADLDAAEMAIGTGQAIQSSHPGVPASQLAYLLEESCRRFHATNDQLQNTARQRPELVGQAILQYQHALAEFVDVARSIAAAEREKRVQRQIVAVSKELVGDCVQHVGASKRVSVSPNDVDAINGMAQAGHVAGARADTLLDVAKGVDLGIVDQAIKSIASSAQKTKTDFQPSQDYVNYRGDVLEHLDAAAMAISNVSSAALQNLRALPKLVPVVTHATDNLIDAVSGAAATTSDPESKPELLRTVVQVATGVVQVLQAVKTTASGGDAGSIEKAKERFNGSSELLLNAISPGKAALESAIERVREALQDQGAMQYTKTPLQDISEAARAISNNTSTLLTIVREDPGQIARVSRDIATGAEDITRASRVATDPSASIYTFAAKKIHADCATLTTSTDFRSIVAAVRSLGLATTDLVNNLGTDPSKEVEALRPLGKRMAGGSLDVYRQVQGVARRTPGARQKMLSSAAQLASLADDFYRQTASIRKAELSQKACDDLLRSTRSVTETTEDLLVKSSHVSANPKDSLGLNSLYQAANALSKGIQDMLVCISSMAPGAVETKQAIQTVQGANQKLQVLSLSAIGGKLQRSNEPRAACTERVIGEARELAENVGRTVKSTLENQSQIGVSVQSVAESLNKLVADTEALARTSSAAQQQAESVDLVKSTATSVLKLCYAVQRAAANPYDTEGMQELQNSSQEVRNSISEIVMGLQGDHAAQQECEQEISRVRQLAGGLQPTKGSGRVQYHEVRMGINARTIELVSALNQLSQLSHNNPDQVGMASREVADLVGPLVEQMSLAAGNTDPAVQQGVLAHGKETVEAVVRTMEHAKTLASERDSAEHQQAMSQSLNEVTSLIMVLQEAVKQGDRAEKAMDEVVKKIRSCTTGLESAGLLSAAAQFDVPVEEGKTLADYDKELTNCNKAIRMACVELVTSANGSITLIVDAAAKVGGGMEAISTVSQKHACLLADNFSQQAVLHGAKALSIACLQVVLAAREVSNRPNDPKAEKNLAAANNAADKAAAQLLDIAGKAAVDIVEKIKRVDAAKARITESYGEFSKATFRGNQKATPENIVIASRLLAKASAQVVSGITSSAEMVMEAVSDISDANVNLFKDGRGCTRLTSDAQVSSGLQMAIRNVAQMSLGLLDSVRQHSGSRPESQQAISENSNKLADGIMALVDATRKLPGAADLELEENDLESVALKELDAASKKISAATARLLAMQAPREGVSMEQHNIHVALIDAAHAVGQAAKVLIESATAAQKELISQGRATKTPSPYRKDPAWAQGLISAAHEVAGTVEDLVSCSNKAVEGDGGEEGVIAAVRMVGGATARLVNASRVKVDRGSRSQQRLEAAAKTVTKCTKELAEAAKLATAHQTDVKMEKSFQSFAGKRAWELQAQTEIAKLEMELENARRRMFKSRKEEYAKKT